MRAKEIRELVKIVQESNIGELEIKKWGQKVRISKTISSVVPASTAPIGRVVSEPPLPGVQQAAPSVAEKAPAPEKEKSNLVEIKAPMVGTFYRASAPDVDPYVKEGDSITSGKVLCIIEAMKLMNEIEAEISGRIVQILVENAQPVEYNQSLFLVEPS
ncbi:MAG: acetyl-CoA carboxylase biotin carboxyl carrier protein [Actinobacteria bacterium]|nr:acetyl-CoA carboxylase biotin carboxyl carrier protein [Actinomycetota bacterium]